VLVRELQGLGLSVDMISNHPENIANEDDEKTVTKMEDIEPDVKDDGSEEQKDKEVTEIFTNQEENPPQEQPIDGEENE